MMKILAALTLTILVPLALLVACCFVAKIPLVQRCFDIDENYTLLTRVGTGFMAILSFIICPICILAILAGLFTAFYGLL